MELTDSIKIILSNYRSENPSVAATSPDSALSPFDEAAIREPHLAACPQPPEPLASKEVSTHGRFIHITLKRADEYARDAGTLMKRCL